MEPNLHTISEAAKRRGIPTVSAVFDDGRIVEMLYDPHQQRTAFAVWQDGQWSIEPSVEVEDQRLLVPYSPHNNLIRNEIVLFASEPEEYCT